MKNEHYILVRVHSEKCEYNVLEVGLEHLTMLKLTMLLTYPQPPEPGPSPSVIIEHAIQKGLISGEGLISASTIIKPKKKKSQTKNENTSMTFAAKQKIVGKKPQEVSIHPRPFRF